MRNTIYRKVLNWNIFGTHSAYIWVKEIREALKLKKKRIKVSKIEKAWDKLERKCQKCPKKSLGQSKYIKQKRKGPKALVSISK